MKIVPVKSSRLCLNLRTSTLSIIAPTTSAAMLIVLSWEIVAMATGLGEPKKVFAMLVANSRIALARPG